MTNQEYTKFTSPAYMNKFTRLDTAIKFLWNMPNDGAFKNEIIRIGESFYGIVNRKIAQLFIDAGYDMIDWTVEDLQNIIKT